MKLTLDVENTVTQREVLLWMISECPLKGENQ